MCECFVQYEVTYSKLGIFKYLLLTTQTKNKVSVLIGSQKMNNGKKARTKIQQYPPNLENPPKQIKKA